MGPPAPGTTKMDRIATAVMIALAALVMQAGLTKGVLADSAGMRLAAAPAAQSSSPAPATGTLRSERVLSLLLTLEALRTAPDLLDPPKV